MKETQKLQSFDTAAAVLPVRLRKAVLTLPEGVRAEAEEIRLRVGHRMSVLVDGHERMIPEIVETQDLEILCDLAADFSRYAAVETLRYGYLPMRGGCRIGLCGTSVIKDGVNTNLRDFSSASIRIAREYRGIGEELVRQLFEGERYCSTLILSVPGGGKTTLLRDLIRCLSNGIGTDLPQRVCVADERGEVGVCFHGVPQMDLGCRTDIMDGCPKALAIPMLLRSMNPQIIAVDEITMQEDLRAISMAAHCGVGLLATIHAADVQELLQKPLYAELLSTHVFSKAVRIQPDGGKRTYQVEDLL